MRAMNRKLVSALAWLATLALAAPAVADIPELFGIGKKDAPAASEDLWAIRCLAITGENRQSRANAYGDALRKVRGLDAKRVLVLHYDEESIVFYGRFARVLDSKSGKERFEPDPAPTLKTIRELYLQNSKLAADDPANWPFRLAALDQLPTGDSSHPEWDLENASGFWAVHVAVFYNCDEMRERKRAAVEYCKMLREQGNEAYYHHGTDKSSVCIGVFPEAAVVPVKSKDALTGAIKVSYGVSDQRVADIMKKFPESLENGHRVFERASGGGGERGKANPSFIVKLPRAARERATGGTP